MLAPAELLDDGVLADEDGVLDEDGLDGALLEPLAALPLESLINHGNPSASCRRRGPG